jgi:hypothetical protein
VTIPVAIPAGSDAVFSANSSGRQTPDRVVQARDAPTVAVTQETDEVRFKFNEPSDAL